MENIENLINSEKSGIQKIIEKIPGFKGYEKKEDRRDADKIVREVTAQRFEEQLTRIASIEKELAKGAGLVWLGDLESAAMKLRRFTDKIKTAAYGYAGLADAVKVDDVALQQLYDYDNYLLSLTDSVRETVDKVEDCTHCGESPEEAIRELNKVAADCITALQRRSEVKFGTENL